MSIPIPTIGSMAAALAILFMQTAIAADARIDECRSA